MQIRIFLGLIAVLLFTNCQTANQKSAAVEFDPSKDRMKHGWAVFTGPKRTIVGVSDENSIQNGRKLFKKHCASCHGVSGKGDGSLAKAFDVKPADLTALSTVAPNHYLVIQISQGSGDMPKWQNLLEPQDIWDLSNYLQTMAPKN